MLAPAQAYAALSYTHAHTFPPLQALAAIFLAFLNEGDEVIVFEPFYPFMLGAIHQAGAIPRVVTLRAPDFAIDEDALREAAASGSNPNPNPDPDPNLISTLTLTLTTNPNPNPKQAAASPRARMLVLNSPHNPTGHCVDAAERNMVAEVCRSRDLLAVSDEVYEHCI